MLHNLDKFYTVIKISQTKYTDTSLGSCICLYTTHLHFQTRWMTKKKPNYKNFSTNSNVAPGFKIRVPYSMIGEGESWVSLSVHAPRVLMELCLGRLKQKG